MTTSFRWMRILFLLSITALPINGLVDSHAEVPAIRNLDLNHVRLVMEAAPEFKARLYDRTMDLFAKAGLPLPHPDQPHSPPTAMLKLTLNPTPLGDTCPGNVLYEPSLALIEPVIVPRNSEVIHDITWSIGAAVQARAPVSIEELESDLDGFVHRFITNYKLGNPEWQSEDTRHGRMTSASPLADQKPVNPVASAIPVASIGVSLRGLDINTLHVSVLAGRASTTLAARALQQLTDAGLPVSLNPHTNDATTLSLELIQRPVEGQCPGKVLYESGLFLVEKVRIERNPQILIWSDTWIRETLQVVSSLSLRQLELDQEALLKQFIHLFQTR
ncbi:MAG: hypothetical protein Q7U76_08635 [Nitrospirota bacterium]|nr:hypothetical protein [Nitrospirota bacterium]